MILEVEWISVVLVEVRDYPLFTRPHVYVVFGVPEMISQTASKVSGSKDENSAFVR